MIQKRFQIVAALWTIMRLNFRFEIRKTSSMRLYLSSSFRRFRYLTYLNSQRRNLLTIAIETSCDDTSVAVLEKHSNSSATLHFHSKITSDNRSYGGIHPVTSHVSHQKNLASLLCHALERLPSVPAGDQSIQDVFKMGERLVKKPDFVTVTRGPGMRASLICGFDTAKGLAVGWQVPLVGVNHMQAHALTPRLLSALEFPQTAVKPRLENKPKFPFLSLLVSGGHTMLVYSRSSWEYEIIANTTDISLGDMLDKSARTVLPASLICSSADVMYGRLLEEFAYPQPFTGYDYIPPKNSFTAHNGMKYGYDWRITPPYMCPGPNGPLEYSNCFSFSGIGSMARSIIEKSPDMCAIERRCLVKTVLEVAFEHVASRVLYALTRKEIRDVSVLVISGGVASNRLLQTILRMILDSRGFQHVLLAVPSPSFCTDNAAMIAWTGIEMFEAGWSTDLHAVALKEWSIDSKSDNGGILGVDGWVRLK